MVQLTPDEELALANAELVRALYPVRWLQVLPVPQHPHNVQIRVRNGAWTVMHVTDAKAFVLTELRRQRKAKQDNYAKVRRRALKNARLHEQAVEQRRKARERAKQRRLDAEVRILLKSRPARP